MVLGATPGDVGITLVSRDTYEYWALTCAPNISEQCSELPYPSERFWFDPSSKLLIFDGADPDWYGTGIWVLELDDSLHTVTDVWSLLGYYHIVGWGEPGHSIIVPGFPASGPGVVTIIDVRSGERLKTIEISES